MAAGIIGVTDLKIICKNKQFMDQMIECQCVLYSVVFKYILFVTKRFLSSL